MASSILGLGTALPEHTMSQELALQMTTDVAGDNERQRRLMRVLFRKSEIRNRNTCIPPILGYDWAGVTPPTDQSPAVRHGEVSAGPGTGERMRLYSRLASPLATRAVTGALADAGLDARDVTHLVTVSCTGFDAPGIDIDLMENLPLRPTTQRVNVGYMGCHGAINGLRVAHGFAAAEPGAKVLISATELCSLHYRLRWDEEGIIGNALFADGSAAMVLGTRAEYASPPEYRLRATGSCLIPGARHVMSWRIGDHGFDMRLTMEVAAKIEQHLRPWMSEWLGQHGHSIGSIGSWAVHPGGPRILQSVEECLELPPEATRVSHEVLAAHGNMSSPTVLFILEKMRRARTPLPCVALGFGPGLVAEAALFD